jgi:hypothetical protein
MGHKSRFHKRASVNAVIVAQVVAQVSAVRHLVATASRRACSSRLAAAEMGTYLDVRRPNHPNSLAGMTVVSLMFWPTVM